MFCSVIIPTIGRSSLERSVKSVLKQNLKTERFEVIVVNDSGKILVASEWQSDERVTIINTQKRERNFARNSGAAVARGRYLIFLDDDDFLLPGSIACFRELANQHPQAIWLYGGIRIIDEKENIIAEINSRLAGNCFAQIMGGAWAPIQASMIDSSTFFELGGYNPLILGTEDLDLTRRFAMMGEFANTCQPIASLQRGVSWNTSTNYQRAPEDTRYSRDLILSRPGVFSRMLASAESGYWRGRILRVYLSTVGFNLRHRRYFVAISRLMFGFMSILQSIWYTLGKSYWLGVNADHVPDTLHYVIKAYEDGLERKLNY